MSNMSNSVLFMNIGTGNIEQSIDEVYIPAVSRAIDSASVDTIILFISTNPVSLDIAQKIQKKYKNYVVEIKQLPDDAMEFNVDQCFEQYYKWMEPYKDKKITIDFTHGTKAMCAALYTCGMFYGVDEFQYTKKKKCDTGFEIGEEIVQKNTALEARWRALFKQCQTLFNAHQYAAVKDILSSAGKVPRNLKTTAERYEMLSVFCETWDRMNYKEALKKVVEFSIPELNYYYDPDDPEIKNMLDDLNKTIFKPDNRNGGGLSEEQFESNINVAINIMFDLYANGLRRIENGQLEDAGIRAYRMAELLGQIYLFSSGYTSDYMSRSNPKVSEFAIRNGLTTTTDIYPPFGRKKVVKFLEFIHFNNETVQYLKDIETRIENLRNRSILVHGYVAQAVDSEALKNLFNDLIKKTKDFISKEDFERKKQIALFLNNFRIENNE